MNVKPAPDSEVNVHAEQMALAKARHNGFKNIGLIAVWGDITDLDSNPDKAPSRRPCKRCSDMFATTPEVEDRTLILSSNSDLSQCEIYTCGELAGYYQIGDSTRPVSEIPVHSLADDMNTEEYDSEIFVKRILPKITSLYPENRFARSLV